MKYFFTFLFSGFFFLLNAQTVNTNTEFYSVERFNEDKTFPKYIEFKAKDITPDNFLSRIKGVKALENINFRLQNIEKDPEGSSHYRYVQVSNGIDVFGSMWIAHEQNGNVISCNGEVFETPKYFNIKYSGEDALQSVLMQHKKTVYYFQLLDEKNNNPLFNPKPFLIILPAVLNEINKVARLVYAIDLYAAEPLSRQIYYVDVNTLEVLYIENKIETTNVPGKANTKYSGEQNIITDSVQPATYRLRENKRGTGNGIETYNMKKGTVYNTSVDFTDDDNYWSNFNTPMDEVAGDVHWGSEMTYDFYKNILNRNSIDNNGFKLMSYVHYSTNYVNAFWNGYFMTYGDGGNGYSPLTSLDVCGHEITHGLTQKTAALIYSNESGALNESFSDIFGVSIDFYTRPAQANFRIGEQFGPGGAGLRDMSDPKIYQNPDTYLGQFWVSDKSDNGGVHYNSGVQNKWFYLLSKGDTGTNDNGFKYKVDSIGYVKAVLIAYKSLSTLLTPLTKYSDARFYSILAAKQLFGDCSNEVKQVINAWTAVGVGDSSLNTVKAYFTSSKNTSCSIPFDVQFFNNSQNANGFKWDFGDGQTSVQTNPIHTYFVFGNFNIKLVASSCNGINKDSITQNNFVKTDANLNECKLTVMPKSNMGSALTNCSGTLRDDGDTSDYGNLVYSVRGIVPTNTSVLKLSFKLFDFEYGYDFLYVYDGPDTLSKLIGKYSGNTLPEGGIIYCKSGAATFRQTSDYLLTGKGFEVDWQCIPKTNTDFRLETTSNIILGRKSTSSELLSNQNISLKVISCGTSIGTSTTLKYKLNNGIVSSKSVALSSGISNTFIGPFDLSVPGSYHLAVWVEDAADGNKENDSLQFTIQQYDNSPVTLPLLENFETLADETLYSKTPGMSGNLRMDYDNTSPQCRLRTNAGTAFSIAGTRSVTVDKSDRNWLSDTIAQTNFIILTYNMSNVAKLQSPLLFNLIYVQHGDKQYPNDAVWERGCDSCAWIKFFDLFVNKAAAGVTKTTPVYNLNYFLDSAKQVLTSSFQLRIGQQDQSNSINQIQYSGYTFDNLRFSTWKTGIDPNSENSFIDIQPNPSHGFFTVKTFKKISKIEVYDMSGKMLWNEIPVNTEFFELNLSTQAKGMYMVNFYDENNLPHAEKIIIH